ncbi:hypothetical protein AN958_10406 [Leucoagaricus sp. SymC.cos]|nr:hypothetical protein AN958_10406 [Leucoagaricus sp. SymC.cos]
MSQLTLTKSQTSIASDPNSPKPSTSYNSLPGSRRYEFARGFLPSTITILSGSEAIYQLSESDTWYTSRNSRFPSVILREATGNRETLATFHPRLFWSDVIEVRVPGGRKAETLRLRKFLKTYYAVTQDTGPSVEMRMRIPDPYSLGLPDGSSLLWRHSPDSRLMTLYSAIGSGADAYSTLLAHASLSQTRKLTSIEFALPEIDQTLLIYIFIAASMIESRLSKWKCEEQEQAHQTLDLTKIKTPKWTIIPLGLGIMTFTTQ